MAPEMREQRATRHDGPTDSEPPIVNEECLTLRNYDSERSHVVQVKFLDANEDVAFERYYTLAPLGVVSVSERLERAVYRVDAEVDAAESASAECLVGSGPGETALVEIGNGLVSVTEGVA